jgi:hypothetical protein
MATASTVKLFAPVGVGGLIQAPNGTYVVASDGTVVVNAADVQYLMSLGFEFAVTDHRIYNTPGAPAAQSAIVTVSSTSLTVGTLTIAAQPDVARQLQAIIYPGTSAITAGVLAFTYVANDGTTQVDSFALTGMASQAAGAAGATLSTTKGVEQLTSAVITGLTGGTTPGVAVGTNNYLAVPVPPRFVDVAFTSGKKVTPTAGTLGLAVPSFNTLSTSLITSGALYSPQTAPDGTHALSIGYTVTYPG